MMRTMSLWLNSDGFQLDTSAKWSAGDTEGMMSDDGK